MAKLNKRVVNTQKKKKQAKKGKAWRDFELEIAAIYRELGYENVVHDINMDGNQIDVYAEIRTLDGMTLRMITSCKYYNSVVGVDDVREWNRVFVSLRPKVDLACIVSAKGFTQDANALGKSTGVKLVPIEVLRLASYDFAPYVQGQLAEFQQERIFAENYYIPMRVCRDGSKCILMADEAIQHFLSKSSSALLTILGDYGAGKTTYCQHLFIELATDFLNNPGKARMPIYINLRTYPHSHNMASLITDVLVNKYGARCRGYAVVEALLKSGRAVILFDAFDEMASRTDYSTTLQNFYAIEGLLKHEAKVLLTCRTHYFKDQEELHTIHEGTELYDRSKKLRYEIIHLQGFHNDEIEKYVKAVCGAN